MILIGYDGSLDAQAAVDHTATLMPGAQTTVLTIWRSFEPGLEYHGGLEGATMYKGPLGHGPQDLDFANWDEMLEAAALAKATEGAERATRAGLQATPQVAKQRASVADALIDAADELDASAIVLGSRGLTGARSWLMGSVSHAALQQADRPVIVIPSAEAASRRAEHRRHSGESRSNLQR